MLAEFRLSLFPAKNSLVELSALQQLLDEIVRRILTSRIFISQKFSLIHCRFSLRC